MSTSLMWVSDETTRLDDIRLFGKTGYGIPRSYGAPKVNTLRRLRPSRQYTFLMFGIYSASGPAQCFDYGLF